MAVRQRLTLRGRLFWEQRRLSYDQNHISNTEKDICCSCVRIWVSYRLCKNAFLDSCSAKFEQRVWIDSFRAFYWTVLHSIIRCFVTTLYFGKKLCSKQDLLRVSVTSVQSTVSFLWSIKINTVLFPTWFWLSSLHQMFEVSFSFSLSEIVLWGMIKKVNKKI